MRLIIQGAFYPGNNQPPPLIRTHRPTFSYSHRRPCSAATFPLCADKERENKPGAGSVSQVEIRTNGGKVTEHSRARAW